VADDTAQDSDRILISPDAGILFEAAIRSSSVSTSQPACGLSWNFHAYRARRRAGHANGINTFNDVIISQAVLH
jgi:hypothetical protein